MRTPNVCTAPATHGRIVSTNFASPGASTSSCRIRREENHFIFAVGTNYHLCAKTLNGSKMFTLHAFSWVTSAFLFCGSGEISALGAAENMGVSPRGARPCSRTKHKAERSPQTPAQVLDLTPFNLIYSLTFASESSLGLPQRSDCDRLPSRCFVQNISHKITQRCLHSNLLITSLLSQKPLTAPHAPVVQTPIIRASRMVG
jgi:hypothetical protein